MTNTTTIVSEIKKRCTLLQTWAKGYNLIGYELYIRLWAYSIGGWWRGHETYDIA